MTQETNQDQVTTSENQENNDQANNEKENNAVPLNTFLEQKKLNKELKEKLASFEAKEKEIEEAKLLEEKNFQELIQKKTDAFNDLQNQLNSERRNNKLERIKNKFSSELGKLNVIDSDDALQLVKFDDLVDAESFDDEIKARTKTLYESKSYLFKSVSDSRDKTENKGTGSAAQQDNNPNASKLDPTLSGLINKFR